MEEEDTNDDTDDTMIAPCRCKGSMKYVHRHCLDNWRMNEPDRAFAQCTECRYTYHLLSISNSQDPSAAKCFWNPPPRTKFCLFVSRDICIITILIQLVIAGLGSIIMLLDKHQHWDLTHLILNPNSNCHQGAGSDSYTTFWCRHDKIAVYYLFGILTLLAIIGMIGSIIYCRNGCSLHHNNKYDDDDDHHVDEVHESYNEEKTNKNETASAIVTKPAPVSNNISNMERGTIIRPKNDKQLGTCPLIFRPQILP